jgi:hypothetical protein
MATDYKMVYKVEELPLAVQIELKPYPMADVDGSYQVGCVTSGPEPKPLSRLIFGAIANDDHQKNDQQEIDQQKNDQQQDGKKIECYVHFESGGFAHTYSARHFTMTSLTANKATLVEATYVPERCATMPELKALLASLR